MHASPSFWTSRTALRLPGWMSFTAGLCGAVWLGAAEEADKNVTRLGFAFDQKAHDAAVAAHDAKAGADQPADDMLHLSKVIVTDKQPPMSPRDVLSPSGKTDLAKKTYLSPVYEKTLGPLAAVAAFLANPLGGVRPNDVEALTLYEDDQQKRRNEEMAGLQAMAALSDPGK